MDRSQHATPQLAQTVTQPAQAGAQLVTTTPQRASPQSSRPLSPQGNRQKAFRIARYHTYLVKTLRLVLPVATISAVVAYAFSAVQTTGWGEKLADLPVPQITAENIKMQNPKYRGFTKDGGAFLVRAATAQQDFDNRDFVKLDRITGELVDAKKMKTTLTARRGTFNTKANVLVMTDGIQIQSQDGMQALLTKATVETKKGIITSQDPVQVSMTAGRIDADSLFLNRKTRQVTFQKNVVARLTPKPSDTAASTANTPNRSTPLVGGSNEPIDITADRLDVDDAKSTAVFKGNVRAVQGQASIVSKQLDIEYENNKSADGTAAATPAPGQAAKVKRIISRYPVLMKQGKTQQVTAQSADFDAVNESALLIGNVVMVDGKNRRAISDRAEIQPRADTALLVGNVRVQQDTNQMFGDRLFIDRRKGLTELTATKKRNGKAGFITTRFIPPKNTKGSQTSTSENKKSGAGSLFAFNTAPDDPVEINAGKLTVRDNKKKAVFLGDVRARQGGFQIRTVRLTAHYEGTAQLGDPAPNAPAATRKKQSTTRLTRVRAETKVVITSSGGQKATGDWANFDLKKNTVVLGGEVILSQGKSVVRGSMLSIDMKTGRSQMETNPSNVAAGWGATLRDKAGKRSSVGIPDTVQIRGGRPNAVFYPGQLRGKKKTKTRKKQPVSKSRQNARQPDASSWTPVSQ